MGKAIETAVEQAVGVLRHAENGKEAAGGSLCMWRRKHRGVPLKKRDKWQTVEETAGRRLLSPCHPASTRLRPGLDWNAPESLPMLSPTFMRADDALNLREKRGK